MGHGHHTSLTANPWPIAVVVVTLIGVVAVIIWLVHRRRVASDGLTAIERRNLPYEQREILSMLRQHGGPMRQDDIVDTLSSDLDDLADVIRRMETQGLIRREWNSDQGTYIVSVQAEGRVNDNGR